SRALTLDVGVNLAGLNFSTASSAVTYSVGGASNLGLSGAGAISVLGTGTINAPIIGSVGLTKIGGGTLILGGANTYTGTTTLGAGTLSVTNFGSLGNSANPVLLNGGTLSYAATANASIGRAVAVGYAGGGIDVGSGTTITANAAVSGFGALHKTGAGTLLLDSVSNTVNGSFDVLGGTLAPGPTAATGHAVFRSSFVNLASTATLFNTAETRFGNLSGSGAVNLGTS